MKTSTIDMSLELISELKNEPDLVIMSNEGLGKADMDYTLVLTKEHIYLAEANTRVKRFSRYHRKNDEIEIDGEKKDGSFLTGFTMRLEQIQRDTAAGKCRAMKKGDVLCLK